MSVQRLLVCMLCGHAVRPADAVVVGLAQRSAHQSCAEAAYSDLAGATITLDPDGQDDGRSQG